jgi:hypothetical protein
MRGLFVITVTVAFGSLSGCATIPSLSEKSRYETPIPHSGQKVAALSRMDTKGYERVTSVVGTVMEVGAAFTPLGAPPPAASSLEAASWVCGHGLTLEIGKKWWEKVSLQPGSLADAISQERCFDRFRRVR